MRETHARRVRLGRAENITLNKFNFTLKKQIQHAHFLYDF